LQPLGGQIGHIKVKVDIRHYDAPPYKRVNLFIKSPIAANRGHIYFLAADVIQRYGHMPVFFVAWPNLVFACKGKVILPHRLFIKPAKRIGKRLVLLRRDNLCDEKHQEYKRKRIKRIPCKPHPGILDKQIPMSK